MATPLGRSLTSTPTGSPAAPRAGPSKLPEIGKGLGKTVKSFQGAAKARGAAAGSLQREHTSLAALLLPGDAVALRAQLGGSIGSSVLDPAPLLQEFEKELKEASAADEEQPAAPAAKKDEPAAPPKQ